MKYDFFVVSARILVLVMLGLLLIDHQLQRDEDYLSLLPPPAPSKNFFRKASLVRDELTRSMELLGKSMDLLEQCFGHPVDLEQMRSLPVTLTAYSSTVDQCDDTPFLTASHQSVRTGIIAVSDDLFNEMGLRFGQRVLIPGHGLFEVQDRMNARWRRRVDIWQENREVALHFGHQQGILLWVERQPEKMETAKLATENSRIQ